MSCPPSRHYQLTGTRVPTGSNPLHEQKAPRNPQGTTSSLKRTLALVSLTLSARFQGRLSRVRTSAVQCDSLPSLRGEHLIRADDKGPLGAPSLRKCYQQYMVLYSLKEILLFLPLLKKNISMSLR